MSRVLVAMSGGVDSAVAAALLVEQGHDVTGVHLKLADVPTGEQIPGQGCCTLDDAQDARRCAQVLGIPFYVWDMTDEFEQQVRAPFVDTYAAGRTPNPCITCNEKVKYAALLERAVSLGFDALATGHHARLVRDGLAVTNPGHGARLRRAVDRAKDQSYVLYMATADQLAHTLLPVGELEKSEVRRRADQLGLRVASKPDSYDVCFIPDGDTSGYLGARLDASPGDVVDLDGDVVGRHDGAWRYTIGQRRGLPVLRTATGNTTSRRYVVDVDAASATVRVGPHEALACSWFDIADPVWVDDVPADRDVQVQVRAHARAVRGRVRVHEGQNGVRVELDEPVFGLAAGQSAAVYDADDVECLGGGVVERAERPVVSEPAHA